MAEDFRAGIFGVEEEHSAGLDAIEHVVAPNVCRIVAGYEIRLVDKVWRADLLFSEPQMGYRYPVGFLRVIHKISLGEHVRVVADDLDRILVRADGSIRAKPPEHASEGLRIFGFDLLRHLEGEVCDVVVDADSEIVGACAGKMVIDGLHH